MVKGGMKMSKNSEAIKKRLSESAEFKQAFEEEQLKLDLADMVFSLREQTGLDQTNFARKVKKSRSTIARIENAQMEPSLSTLKDIAHSLGKQIEINFVDDNKNNKAASVK